ncbi:MAG TPA: hypothetical protein VLA72_08440 [Anaerolineales bacterium]|nr:hypothetical protein [Anaerolineales bacterium]
MNKKIILNGIELSLSKYDNTAATLFDYLEDVVTNLEKELSDEDGNFQLSIDVDFSISKPPKHSILSSNAIKTSTENKIDKALTSSNSGKFNQFSGSVKVDLQVKDR